MVRREEGEPVVYLNEKIIGNPWDLLSTNGHEDSHYLSGKGDYTPDFLRFMMAVAMSNTDQRF
jgi:hypothetical protein